MNQRPVLDPSSFEKLLGAAWVLQRQREREAGSRVGSQESTRGAQGTKQAVLLPSLAGCASSPEVKANEPVSLPTPAKTTRSRAPRRNASRLFTDLRKWIEAWRRYRVNIRVKASSRRTALAACLPSLILGVMLAFVLSEISRQGDEVAAATLTPASVPAEVGQVRVVGAKTRSVDLESAGISLAALAESHQRITDPDTQAVVDGLSGHEIRVLKWQAEGGDDSAALTIGMLYEIGRYVPQSCSQATEWITKSATWGNAAAEYNLGLRYRQGDGVLADEKQAEQWLQKAADQGYPEAEAAVKEKTSRGF